MHRPRFRISSLIAVVFALAPLFAIAANNAVGVESIVMLFGCLAVHFVVSIAVVGAVVRRGRNRAFWIGFAVFGGLWLSFLWLLISANDASELLLLALAVPPLGFLGGQIGQGFWDRQAREDGSKDALIS